MPPKKATSEQYRVLVNLVKECDCVRWGKGTPDQKREAWENISSTLNAVGGVEKNAEGWKKAYTEMKSHIKAKIRAQKSLNEIETKCAEISGLFISCAGLPDVPELGVNVETFIVEKGGGILVPEVPEITDEILVQEEHPEFKVVLEKELEETQAEANAQEKAQTIKKKLAPKKSLINLCNYC